MSCRFYLGIDVAKAKLDCLLLDTSNAKRKAKSIANSADGVAVLLSWLTKQDVAIQDVQVIMEPTGVYHEHALLALAQAGLAVSLINPAQLRKFAQGIGVKTKTDAADSAVLARYGAANHPRLPMLDKLAAAGEVIHFNFGGADRYWREERTAELCPFESGTMEHDAWIKKARMRWRAASISGPNWWRAKKCAAPACGGRTNSSICRAKRTGRRSFPGLFA